jgi:hypothetical protein
MRIAAVFVTSIAAAGFAVPAQAGVPCDAYVHLRNAATAAWNEAMRAPPYRRCGPLNHASAAAATTLRYAGANRASCDISSALLGEVQDNADRTARARDNVCAGRPMRGYPAEIIRR